MANVYLPLLPLPVLAVLVAVSACSKPREETTHVIPPAAPWVASAATVAPPPPAAAPVAEAPSAAEVKEFERPVRK